MKFSTRARYGLRVMVDLAGGYAGGEPMPLSEIAHNQGLSEGYLEQLMTLLRKGGLVSSIRGAKGGYILARDPAEITAGDIIRCLEGPLAPTECVREGGSEGCVRAGMCATRVLWDRLRRAMADVLDGTTLLDLHREAEEMRKANEPVMYYI